MTESTIEQVTEFLEDYKIESDCEVYSKDARYNLSDLLIVFGARIKVRIETEKMKQMQQ